MLQRILEFKERFISGNRHSTTDFNSFKANLLQFAAGNNINIPTQDIYWKNYFHATIVSSLFELLNNYDLNLWNQYFQNIEELSDSLNVEKGAEGSILELFILHTINNVFNYGKNPLQIKALRAKNNSGTIFLTDDSNDSMFLSPNENEYLLDNLMVGMKIPGFPMKKIWGDNDIIVTFRYQEQIQQFCIISCKTSLRERVYQSIFWATHSRLESIGKHILVTLDKGASGSTEIGHRQENNKARKTRDVIESTMDRSYVFRSADEVNRSQSIKDFPHLRIDLQNWARDIAGIENIADAKRK